MADVSAAVAAAPAGSIVQIPAGTFTWGAGGAELFIYNSIVLEGAGPANNVPRHGPNRSGAI